MKIAVFGGTFNPIHNGHINLMKFFLNKKHFDKIIVIPNNIPPHKIIADNITSTDRYNMCCIATQSCDRIITSSIEIKKLQISYTFDTLKELSIFFPNDELYLLIGSDEFYLFHFWKNYRLILDLADLFVVTRGKNEYNKMKKYSKILYKHNNIRLFNINFVNISSSIIRKKIKMRENISDLVPAEVKQYIKGHNLYL